MQWEIFTINMCLCHLKVMDKTEYKLPLFDRLDGMGGIVLYIFG